MEAMSEKELYDRLESVMPRTCQGVATRLQRWMEIGKESHFEAVILEPDGSMNNDLFALIGLAMAYFKLAGDSRESWQNLCLLQARAAIIKSCLGALRGESGNAK